MRLLFLMLFAHALGDFILTSEALSRYKNRHIERPSGVPRWGYWLTAHALTHGGLMYLVTNNIGFGIYITITHWIIDYRKCNKKINADQDQVLHIACILFALTTGVL